LYSLVYNIDVDISLLYWIERLITDKKELLNKILKTNEEYIKDAIGIHGNKYSYEKTVYLGSKKKVCIICPKHGEFWQEANSHLKGCGCPMCFREKRSEENKTTFDKFIRKCRMIHGELYHYDESTFTDMHTKTKITCPIHGEFWQTPASHLNGKGCPKCSRGSKYTTEDWIEKSKTVHGETYDYSKSNYISTREKICIICPKHGEFWQLPNKHLEGQGCPNCSKEKRRYTIEQFIEMAKKVHGDKYDYSNSEYVNSRTKIKIICQKHGEFWMKPNDHLNGQGCPKCGDEKMADKSRLNINEILNRFSKIYNDKYSYELWNNDYKNIEDVIPIICPKHGLFHKTVHQHLQGQGCPKCNSSILENNMRNFLNENSITFSEQQKFDWLGKMSFDFYLSDYKIAIECQGEQHFKPFEYFGGELSLEKQIKRDKLKEKLATENDIEILYYSNKKYNDNIITDKKEILNKILKNYE